MNESEKSVAPREKRVNPTAFHDKTGLRYSRLVALRTDEPYKKTKKWICVCDSGKGRFRSHLQSRHWNIQVLRVLL